ncbi:MAG: adenylate kinase [Methanomicrobiales archaeon]|nr:adenylate kinase [Methanomicrobiales archaeon]
MGKRVIITGVPGVGKTTVVEGAMKALATEGIIYQPINFGSFMFEVAAKEGIVQDRDQMRKLDRTVQKKLQKMAAQAIAAIEGNIIIDTHCSVKTPQGFLPGLPEWVLSALLPDMLILVETDEDQILQRRLRDPTRIRDMEGSRGIADHQQFNRSAASAIGVMTGCTVKIVKNQDFLLEQAIQEMAAALR